MVSIAADITVGQIGVMGVRQITYYGFVMLLLIDIGILAEAEYVFFKQQADVIHQRHIDIPDSLLLP